jgi:transposase
MGQVVRIGLDLAKSVFPVHGVDEAGEIMVRRKLRRSQLLAFFARQPACRHIRTECIAAAAYTAANSSVTRDLQNSA